MNKKSKFLKAVLMVFVICLSTTLPVFADGATAESNAVAIDMAWISASTAWKHIQGFRFLLQNNGYQDISFLLI